MMQSLIKVLPSIKFDSNFFMASELASSFKDSWYLAEKGKKKKIFVSDSISFLREKVQGFGEYGILLESDSYLQNFETYDTSRILFIPKENFESLERIVKVIAFECITSNNSIIQKDFEKKIDIKSFLNESERLFLDIREGSESEKVKEGVQSFFLNFLTKDNFTIESLQDMNEFCERLKSSVLISDIKLLSLENVLKTKNDEMLIPVFRKSFSGFLKVKMKSKYIEHENLILSYIHFLINAENLFRGSKSDLSSLTSKVLDNLQWPLVVINNEGSVVFHNSLFGKLNLSLNKLLQLKNEDILELDNENYFCHRTLLPIENEELYLIQLKGGNVIRKAEHGGAKLSSRELGIVTSSIAHELNNPIAGIIAALSVLGLEVEDDSEIKSEILEMKKSAKRCKDLIEVFLGFSRQKSDSLERVEIGMALDHAHDLCRIRMIETNFLISIENKTYGHFFKMVNSSILTMIFYLLLNEIITYFSKQGLLNMSHEKSEKIFCEITSKENKVKFAFDRKLKIDSLISQSKLLKNLLTMQNISYEQEKDGFSLTND